VIFYIIGLLRTFSRTIVVVVLITVLKMHSGILNV